MALTPPRSLWSRLRSPLTLTAIGGFMVLSVWARFNPVQADEAPGAKAVPTNKVQVAQANPTDPAKGKGKLAQKKGRIPLPVVNAPMLVVPGAGMKLEQAALTKLIDQQIQKKLQENNIKSSPLSDDAEFLRRVSLDLIGVIPTAEKVEEFLKNTDPQKRAKVIDELLADKRFGTSLGETWSGLMIPRESNNRALDHTPMQQWLAEKFNADMPLDKMVHEILTATGELDKNGAVTYFIGNPTVDKVTDNVSRMFLGVQLQCAQCHNHPFTDWKQKEYWGMAAFFMKVKASANPQQAAKKGVPLSITESLVARGKKNGLPESAMIVPAKFLGDAEPKLNEKDPYRPILADWIISGKNPYFAKAMVNRFWYQLFGRGLVNPVDDMHDENPATHPELLAALTEQFKSSGHDLKYLLRAILNSETYQRTSRPFAGNEADPELYSHAAVRVMTAEQLFDSLAQVVGSPRDDSNKNRPAAGGKKGPVGARGQFLAFFRIDEGADPLEYQSGIPQALRLMNSQTTNATTGAIARAMKSGATDSAKVIEQLYLMGLSRLPTTQESQRMQEYVRNAGDARAGYTDILWALLNSSEFTLNH